MRGSTGLQKELLSVDDAAEVMSVSDWTVKKLIASGELASLKIANRRLIPRAAIAKFIELRTSPTTE